VGEVVARMSDEVVGSPTFGHRHGESRIASSGAEASLGRMLRIGGRASTRSSSTPADSPKFGSHSEPSSTAFSGGIRNSAENRSSSAEAVLDWTLRVDGRSPTRSRGPTDSPTFGSHRETCATSASSCNTKPRLSPPPARSTGDVTEHRASSAAPANSPTFGHKSEESPIHRSLSAEAVFSERVPLGGRVSSERTSSAGEAPTFGRHSTVFATSARDGAPSEVAACRNRVVPKDTIGDAISIPAETVLKPRPIFGLGTNAQGAATFHRFGTDVAQDVHRSSALGEACLVDVVVALDRDHSLSNPSQLTDVGRDRPVPRGPESPTFGSSEGAESALGKGLDVRFNAGMPAMRGATNGSSASTASSWQRLVAGSVGKSSRTFEVESEAGMVKDLPSSGVRRTARFADRVVRACQDVREHSSASDKNVATPMVSSPRLPKHLSAAQLATLAAGTQVDYYSQSHRCWVPAIVERVNAEAGSVGLNIKPGHDFDLADLQGKVRIRSKPNLAQLEKVRALLREGEGRLRAESASIFYRHVRQGSGGGSVVLPLPTLPASGLAALASELDSILGVSISLGILQKELRATGCKELASDGFARAFSDLLWHVECECGQVLMTQPKRRQGDPWDVYSSQQTLGSGVYGPVRFATHKETGITHAVKVLRRTGLTPGSQDEHEQLDHELNHLLRLDHPNIVKLYEHFENSEGMFLVMDYCSGGQLESMLQEARLSTSSMPPAFVADVTRQVLSAAAHMHSRSVVHLDLGASNIMLMASQGSSGRARDGDARYTFAQVKQRPHVMVIDFGVAQVLRPGMAAYRTPSSVGATLAPEVWQGDITPKADVFGCGALLFEMLGLVHPFTCPREYVQAVDFWHKKPKATWKKLKNAPPEAVELCRKMLSLDRRERPDAHQCYHSSTFLQQSDASCASLVHSISIAAPLLKGLENVPMRTWLHKSIALSIARSWPANQLPTVKRLFHSLDVSGQGRLDKSDIVKALELLDVPNSVALNVADAMDLSREGNVTWTEFVAACADLAAPKYEEHLRRIFEAADRDGDGLLSQEDVASMFATECLCADVARDVFIEMTGRDEAGARVDWPTFRRHFAKGSSGSERQDGDGDVAGAVKQGVIDLVRQAHSFVGQVRGQMWQGGPNDDDSGGSGSAATEEQKLQQLAAMGFEAGMSLTSGLGRPRTRHKDALRALPGPRPLRGRAQEARRRRAQGSLEGACRGTACGCRYTRSAIRCGKYHRSVAASL